MPAKLDHLQQLHLTPFETPKERNVHAGSTGVRIAKIGKITKSVTRLKASTIVAEGNALGTTPLFPVALQGQSFLSREGHLEIARHFNAGNRERHSSAEGTADLVRGALGDGYAHRHHEPVERPVPKTLPHPSPLPLGEGESSSDALKEPAME